MIKNDPQGGVIVEVNGGRLVRLSQSGRIDRSFADDGVLDPGIPVRSRYGVLFTIRLFDRVNGRILGRGLTEGANGRWGIDRRLRGGRYSLLLRGRRLEDRLVCSRARLDFRLPRQSRR